MRLTAASRLRRQLPNATIPWSTIIHIDSGGMPIAIDRVSPLVRSDRVAMRWHLISA